jgi:hypothetical protein
VDPGAVGAMLTRGGLESADFEINQLERPRRRLKSDAETAALPLEKDIGRVGVP